MFEGVPDVFTAKDAATFALLLSSTAICSPMLVRSSEKEETVSSFSAALSAFALDVSAVLSLPWKRVWAFCCASFSFWVTVSFAMAAAVSPSFTPLTALSDDLNGALQGPAGFAQKVEIRAVAVEPMTPVARLRRRNPGNSTMILSFPLFLDHRFGDPEAVDAVFNNRIGTLENVAGGLFGKVRPVPISRTKRMPPWISSPRLMIF